MREAGVDFRRFLSLIADLDDRDIADLRRRVMAASAVGHLPSALNGGAGAIEASPSLFTTHNYDLRLALFLTVGTPPPLPLSLLSPPPLLIDTAHRSVL